MVEYDGLYSEISGFLTGLQKTGKKVEGFLSEEKYSEGELLDRLKREGALPRADQNTLDGHIRDNIDMITEMLAFIQEAEGYLEACAIIAAELHR